jgi:D-inositol-3-phosphate glycosyltransferase
MPLSPPVTAIPSLRIAMFCIHSSPLGPLGTQDTGGMSVYVRELAKWLGHWGHRVDIFSYTGTQAGTLQLYPNVRLVLLVPPNGRRVTKAQLPRHLDTVFNAIADYCQRHNCVYDLIHSHYWLSGMVGAMAQARWRRPHITMFHTLGMVKNNTASGENESEARIAHERWLAAAADAIVVPADRERRHLLDLYRADPLKIRVIPCGVDLELFQPGDRKAWRRLHGIAPDAEVALYVGRFAPLKGIDTLLEAVADLKSEWPRLHLLVVGGDGPDSQNARALVRMVRELGIQDRVTFKGRVDQSALPGYYNACDFLAVPSHYESFGLVILEALACGTPVVTTPVGAVETIIRPEHNGIIIEAHGRGRLAEGMARLLSASRSRPFSPLKVRATVLHYGWDRIAASMIETYQELMTAHDASSALVRGAAEALAFPN